MRALSFSLCLKALVCGCLCGIIESLLLVLLFLHFSPSDIPPCSLLLSLSLSNFPSITRYAFDCCFTLPEVLPCACRCNFFVCRWCGPPHPTLLLIWCVCVCRCVAWRGDLCLSPCSLVDSAAFRSLFEMCMHWPVSWLACMTTSRRAVSGHVYACVHQRLYRGMQDRCLRCFCCLLMPSISSTLSFLSLFPSLAPTLMWALSLGEFSRSGDVTSPVRAA